MSSTRALIVYGGAGALGKSVISQFKALGDWNITNIDFQPNVDANLNLSPSKADDWSNLFQTLEKQILKKPFDAIVCTAGGWCGGNALGESFLNSIEISVLQSVQSSAIASHLAAKHLTSDGVLFLTGAQAALQATPGMIGYGMAKASVHHLIKSLADSEGGLPKNAKVFGILPSTLDTPSNRASMPSADTSSWTPCNVVAKFIADCVQSNTTLKSGTLFKFETALGKTSVSSVTQS